MARIRRLGAMGLTLALLLTLLPTPTLAADEYSYQPVNGYEASEQLTVESYSLYPWTYDSATGIFTSGNHDLNLDSKATLSRLKVTALQDGYLKFDYAMNATTDYDVIAWRKNEDYTQRTDATASGKNYGVMSFTSVGAGIDVEAGDVIYIAYSKGKLSADADYGQLRNLRLATGGTVEISSSNKSLGTVSSSLTDMTNLKAGTQVTLTANETGGQFEGWYETIGSETTRISGDKTFTYIVTESATVQARFIGVAADAVAMVGDIGYDTVSAALADAAFFANPTAPVTVKLIQNVEITEDLTIPANVILLVPYCAEDDGIDPELVTQDENRQKGNIYRKLTVAEGVTVTVNGTLLVNASLASSDHRHQGSLGGDYGALELNGPLTVNDGGALKVRGMLTGSGSVTAQSGGEILQAFEITDWPGGSVATKLYGEGQFPLNQYYFQRIQVPITMEYGSEMSLYMYLLVPSEGNAMQTNVKGMIGTSDTSFFKMYEGSRIVLGYDANTYTTTLDVHGKVEARSFYVSLGVHSISTGNVVCPIPASFAITVKTGAVLTIEKGAKLIVQEDVEIYLYGTNEYNEGREIPSSSDLTTPITPSANSVIFNSGTLENNGVIHTSAGVNNQIQSVNNVGTVTGSGIISQGTVGQILISYDANGGQGTIASHYARPGEAATLMANSFTRPGFNFLGWSADPSFYQNPFLGTEELITDLNIAQVPEMGKTKLTLYAIWEKEPIADPSEYAIWLVGGTTYTDFNAALTAAANSGSMVVLHQSGTLPAGEYTIPSNVRVLIPYDSNYSFDVNPIPTTTYVTPSNPYAVLTMENGAHITVNGALNVGSRICSGVGGSIYSGAPTGNSARIEMKSGSAITVNGTLYAYGFITGTGTVSAEYGSVIHETFQLCEQRGGSNLMSLMSGTFPITQYYVQNIEAKLVYKYGCTEILHTNMYMLDTMNACDNIPFLGSSSGLFRLSSGAQVIRTYDPNTDRITLDITGNVSFASTTITIQGQTVDTSRYTLPITNNYTINIHSGTTSLEYPMEFLPGVNVTIDQGATLSVIKLHVYDRDEWVGKGFVYNGLDLISVPYSPTKKYTRTSDDLTDASINVNGALVSRNSSNDLDGLYTTKSGANIYTSEGTGTVTLGVKASLLFEIYTLRLIDGNTKVTVPSAVVRLHNTNGTAANSREFTETIGYPAGSTFHWCQTHGCWESQPVTVTFDPNNGDASTTVTLDHNPNVLPEQAETLTKAGLTHIGWSWKAEQAEYTTVTMFAKDGDFADLRPNDVLTAVWAGDVTWIGGDGNPIRTDRVNEGVVPVYDGTPPTKTTDAQYVYTFAGWSTEPNGAVLSEIPAFTGNVTYYAVFTGEVRSYTVTWKDWDDSVLATQTLHYGMTPEYPNSEPTRATVTTDDYVCGYRFYGWTPSITPVTGDVTYVADFSPAMTYYVRFYNADGSLLSERLVQPGVTPTAPDVTAPSGQTFVGWATTQGGEALSGLPTCSGAVKYYAVFETNNSGLSKGDITGDGIVDSSDLAALLANFNKSGSSLKGDINFDGIVDSSDLAILLANFNKSIS